MSLEKIVYLPFSSTNAEVRFDVHYQYELFKLQDKNNYVLYLNPDKLNQDYLLKIITQQQMKLIIDLRPRPVFRKPCYNHKKFVSYLFDRSIVYLEVAKIAQNSNDTYEGYLDALRKMLILDGSSGSNVTLCLIDQSAVDSGIVTAFRQALSKFGKHFIEINPRSLLRLS